MQGAHSAGRRGKKSVQNGIQGEGRTRRRMLEDGEDASTLVAFNVFG
jgi:hypothetical protein